MMFEVDSSDVRDPHLGFSLQSDVLEARVHGDRFVGEDVVVLEGGLASWIKLKLRYSPLEELI